MRGDGGESEGRLGGRKKVKRNRGTCKRKKEERRKRF